MKGKPWRKVLYENQGVPDNYVDASFLVELRKNVNSKKYKVLDSIIETGVVSQEVCSVCLLGVVYSYLEDELLSPDWLFAVSILMVIAGYVVIKFVLKAYRLENWRWFHDIKSVFILLSFGFSMSPILHTLTETISTDTIYALAVIMMLIYLLFKDYGVDSAFPLSLNAGLFGSVCLASRLSTPWSGFILLTFAMEMLALFPLFRKYLKEKYSCFQVFWTICLTVAALYSVSTISLYYACLLGVMLLFLNIIFPVFFVHLQTYKDNIYGPWDEATPNIKL